MTSREPLEKPSLKPAHSWLINLCAAMTLLSGLAGTFQPLTVRLSEHPRLFQMLVPYELYHWSNSLSVLAGYLLIFLSINLFKRKQAAWLLSFLLSLATVALQLARLGSEHIHFLQRSAFVDNLPAISVLPACLTIALLLLTRSSFTVKSEPSYIEALKKVGISLLAVLAYGCLGFFLLDKRDFGINFQLFDSLICTARELTLLGNNFDDHTKSRFAHWFLESLRLYGIVAYAGITYSAFRPVHYRLLTLPRERELAGEILDRYGNCSLDYFKLLPDKSYFFNQSKDGFIAYKTVLNVAIALGDATTAGEKLEALIKEYITFCRNNGWSVAFLQTTPAYLEIYRRCGLKDLKVGEDAVVPLKEFAEKTVNKKTFKSIIKKFDKEGYQLVKHQAPHSESLLDQVEEISKQWLSLPGRRERGFSLGQFDRQDLQKNNLYVLINKAGEAMAFVNEIRSYRPGEATIDMMRYKTSAENGTMDYLFAKLLLNLKEQGFTHFSLGLAALSGVGEDPTDGLYEKTLKQVYEHLNRFFSYKGLRNYKAKFEPIWEERFLVYEGQTPKLVKAGLAIARATEE